MDITRKVWVIMDKKRGIIGTGVPRNRTLKLVSDIGQARILTYRSKKTAETNFKTSWFYDGDGVNDYFEKEYGIWHEYQDGNYIQHGPKEEDCMEAVEVEMIMRELSPVSSIG